jgi:hypothetical protein
MRVVKTWLALGSAGLLIGVCLSIGSAGALLANRAVHQRAALTAAAGTVTRLALLASHTKASTPTLIATAAGEQTATSTANRWFDQAEQLLKRGETQRVVDLLQPERETLKGNDLAKADYYLGNAECGLGHYQLCAAYMSERQTLDPSAENLAMLAAAYDAGGDLKRAADSYKALTEWSGREADAFRSQAQIRMAELNRILESRLKLTLTPTPWPTETPRPLFVDPKRPYSFLLATGTGKFTITPGQRQLFRFVPSEFLNYPVAQSLTFRLLAADVQGPTTLELAVWRQDNDTFDKVVLKWGDNPISSPRYYVDSRGEVSAELYNPGPETYVVDNAGFAVGILEASGKVTVYGLK